jgi:aspartate carbamoyltransferase catalytic subunit
MLAPDLAATYGVEVFTRPEPALEGADAVMMLRIQLERQSGALFPGARDYSRVYGLDHQRLKLARPYAIIMHPGPVNQGVEMTPEIYDDPRSVILPQVTNGVAVRMALLHLLIERPAAPAAD